jgi:DNA (cytosine-5)-methyltransferase 1
MLITRGLERVLGNLTALGYDSKWTVMGAADVGANHQRDRIWIVAKLADTSQLFCNGGNDNSRISLERKTQSESGDGCREKTLADSNESQRERNQCSERITAKYANTCSTTWWASEPNVGRVADGVAARVDRLKAIGNGQVPLCAATAWRLLTA